MIVTSIRLFAVDWSFRLSRSASTTPIAAAVLYQSRFHVQVNSFLRSPPGSSSHGMTEILEVTESLDAAIAESTAATPLVVYRGIRNFLDTFGIHRTHARSLVGETFTDPAFVSTSVRRSIVEREFL